MTMPVSVTLPQFRHEVEPMLEAARRAEAIGFDGAFVFDHLFPLDGKERPVVEALVALAAVAAATNRIRVGTLVMRATTRPAWTTAHAAWTAQAVAGGRLVLGLGTGDTMSAAEMTSYGIGFDDLEERLAVVEATIDALDAPELALPGLARPQVWLGGTLRVVRETAAARADGWNVWGKSAEWMEERVPLVRAVTDESFTVSWGGAIVIAERRAEVDRLLERRGGDAGVLAGTPDELAVQLERYRRAGVDELVVSILPGDSEEPWRLFAERVRPALA